MKSNYWSFLVIKLSIVLTVFILTRLAHFFIYPEFWEELTLGGRAKDMLFALRFDLSIFAKTFLVLELCYLLLGRLTSLKFFYYLLCALSGALLIAFIHIQLFSLFIFELVGRHVVFEYSEWFRHFGSVFREAIFSHGLLFFPATAFLLFIAYLWFRLWKRFYLPQRPKYLVSISWALLILVVGVIAGRGGVQGMPLQESFAINGETPLQTGYLRLNSVYTLMGYIIRDKVSNYELLSEDEARANVLSLTDTDRMISPNPDYPLLKQFNSFSSIQGKYNFVLLIMESWNARMIASLTPESSRMGYLKEQVAGEERIDLERRIEEMPAEHPLKAGLTPNFDKMAKEGLLFTSFYSNGTNSIEGLASMIMSMPPMNDFVLANSSFVQNRMSSVNSILKENGYRGIYLSGLYDGSGNNDTLLSLGGIDLIIEKSKFDSSVESPDPWGLYDGQTLDRLNQELDRIEKPFFAYFVSISTHSPYSLPKDFTPLLPDSVPKFEYLNEMNYSDHALGKFFEKEKTSAHFSNTIYFIIADHTAYISPNDATYHERIPLLIYAPGIIQPGKVEQVSSQIDLLPTIADIIGYKKPFTTAGRSLLDNSGESERYALILTGGVKWLQDDLLVHVQKDFESFKSYRRSDGEPVTLSSEETATYFRNLKAYYQIVNNSIINNSLMPFESLK